MASSTSNISVDKSPATLPAPLVELARFFSKVDVPLYRDGCWVWKGAQSDSGYGVHARGRAHRVAYQWFRGPIPKGMTIDHVCRNKLCVNVEHMEVVTSGENIRRAAKARFTGYCRHGHNMMLPGNHYVERLKSGTESIRCAICCRKKSREFQRRAAAIHRAEQGAIHVA